MSYTFQRIPDTQSCVITKVYDFLGQPSYIVKERFSGALRHAYYLFLICIDFTAKYKISHITNG